MYDYIKGKVTNIKSNYITIDVCDIGYKIYTPAPYAYKEEEIYKIYLYQYVREDEISLYGFMKEEERELFLKLIEVKGLGCKMALPILATGSIDGIKDAVERENVLYLKKFPKIGDKVAKQIILDLKGKLDGYGGIFTVDSGDTAELVEALQALGYKQTDIKKVIPSIDTKLPVEEQIKQALKLLLK